jgi:polyhydroxybutyrate depolymerase
VAPTTSTTSPPPTTTTAPGPPVAGGTTGCRRAQLAGERSSSFRYLGVERTYVVHVPVGYDPATPVPLVLDLHGYGSDGRQQLAYSGFDRLADRERFLVVAPDGQGTGLTRHWAFGDEPGAQDDLAMVGALLDHVEAELCVDVRRVFSTGMSNGAAMTDLLACVASDRIAAFAPVAATVYVAALCTGRPPAPILAFHGTADPVVPFDGGTVTCCGHATVAPASEAMAAWAQHDGCAATPVEAQVAPDVTRRSWPRCAGGADVVFDVVQGGGHTWPGSIPIAALGPTSTFDATAAIWSFFRAHPRR